MKINTIFLPVAAMPIIFAPKAIDNGGRLPEPALEYPVDPFSPAYLRVDFGKSIGALADGLMKGFLVQRGSPYRPKLKDASEISGQERRR